MEGRFKAFWEALQSHSRLRESNAKELNAIQPISTIASWLPSEPSHSVDELPVGRLRALATYGFIWTLHIRDGAQDALTLCNNAAYVESSKGNRVCRAILLPKDTRAAETHGIDVIVCHRPVSKRHDLAKAVYRYCAHTKTAAVG